MQPRAFEPAVLTIIAAGTQQHRSRPTILHQLYNSIDTAKPNHYRYLLDGIGGVQEGKDEHYQLGTYYFDVSFDKGANQIITKKWSKHKNLKKNLNEKATQYAGLVAGKGCDDGIREILEVIRALYNADKRPLTLNLFGFSRGADLLIRLCNILNTIYPDEDITINLFAIDAVPGPIRDKEEISTTIPGNVKHAVFIYMENDVDNVLVPSCRIRLVKQSKDTTVDYKILKGCHCSAQVFYSDASEPVSSDPKSYVIDGSRILLASLQEFADLHGIKTKDDRVISPVYWLDRKDDPRNPRKDIRASEEVSTMRVDARTLFGYYNRMLVNEEAYKELSENERNISKKINIDLSSVERSIYERLKSNYSRKFDRRDYYLHGTNFFQDLTHLNLFKTFYSHYFDYFFQANKGGSTPTDVINDIILINANDSDLVKLLDKKNYPISLLNEDAFLPPPMGIPVKFDELYENEEILRLWDNIATACYLVRRGADLSIEIEKSETLLIGIQDILCSDEDSDSKITLIQQKVVEFVLNEILSVKDKDLDMLDKLRMGIFLHKLFAILGENTFYAKMAGITIQKLYDAYNEDEDRELLDKTIGYISTLASSDLADRSVADSIMEHLNELNKKISDKDLTKICIFFSREHFIVNLVTKSLEKYIAKCEGRGIIKVSPEIAREIEVAKKTIECLEKLIRRDAGNDQRAIEHILRIALLVAGHLRKGQNRNKSIKESRINTNFENLLRANIRDVASFNSPVMITDHIEVNNLIDAFERYLTDWFQDQFPQVSVIGLKPTDQLEEEDEFSVINTYMEDEELEKASADNGKGKEKQKENKNNQADETFSETAELSDEAGPSTPKKRIGSTSSDLPKASSLESQAIATINEPESSNQTELNGQTIELPSSQSLEINLSRSKTNGANNQIGLSVQLPSQQSRVNKPKSQGNNSFFASIGSRVANLRSSIAHFGSGITSVSTFEDYSSFSSLDGMGPSPSRKKQASEEYKSPTRRGGCK